MVRQRPLRQLVQRSDVVAIDVQDLLEVSKGRFSIAQRRQSVLRPFEQQGDALVGGRRPGGQPIRQQAVESLGAPRRRQVGAEEGVGARVGTGVVRPQLDGARQDGDGVIDPSGLLVGGARFDEQRSGPPSIADQDAEAGQRPRLAQQIAPGARHPSHAGPGFEPVGIERDDAAISRERGAELSPALGVQRRL